MESIVVILPESQAMKSEQILSRSNSFVTHKGWVFAIPFAVEEVCLHLKCGSFLLIYLNRDASTTNPASFSYPENKGTVFKGCCHE